MLMRPMRVTMIQFLFSCVAQPYHLHVEASHGQIYTSTRSGYSQPATIPWP
ncbi:MAG: hypothetical protein HY867_06630 [Chloroflexi bacterium]|nr:hypothetical protein [Chloroflexota bacterium]